jgi:hypothetical protein
MGRNDIGGTSTQVLTIPRFDGQNTALAFNELKNTESLKMNNALPGSLGSLSKRPGTIPITDTQLDNPIKKIFSLRKDKQNHILVSAGDTLYKIENNSLVAQTMTHSLVNADVDAAQFKDENGKEVLVLADGGNLKAYDGTAVYDVVPAADDESPLPANDLTNINTDHKPTGCLIHNTRVVIWDGSDTIWHSKVGYYDYFPQTDYQRFVRRNDHVQTCVSYKGALVVLLRRHIGVLFGHDIDNWSQDFLDTTDGCLNPNTVQTVMFPDGRQEVFYLTDNGVSSVYTIDTLSLDSSARYSTRSVTKMKIDWEKLGVTREEWGKACAHFHNGKYWLVYPKGTEWKGLVFDTNYENWYPISNVEANGLYHDEESFLFVGDHGHVKKFDDDLYSDWDDIAKTSGTPIDMYWYSNLLTTTLTGYNHMWDILMVEARNFMEKSSIDIEVNTLGGQYLQSEAIKTAVMIWGETNWNEAQWVNPKLTELVNNAKRLRVFLKGQYLQLKLSNNRDEPVEIFNLTLEVRTMGK